MNIDFWKHDKWQISLCNGYLPRIGQDVAIFLEDRRDCTVYGKVVRIETIYTKISDGGRSRIVHRVFLD